MNDAETKATIEAMEAIDRIANFSPDSLVRARELGQALSFANAVEPANKIINLYKKIPIKALIDFPSDLLEQVKEHAQHSYRGFDEILNFSPNESDAFERREALINQLKDFYDLGFPFLHSIVAYSAQSVIDFDQLKERAEQTIESMENETSKIIDKIRDSEAKSSKILENIRKTAAESGVSQQAIYFDNSVKNHNSGADRWHKYILVTGCILGLYAISTLIFHKINLLADADPVQLAISKILIFGVISSYLFICIKNYISHKHNSVVDRHRQNALLTYQALVDAAGDTPNKEVILVHAAACIFGPQSTGYAKDPVVGQSGVQQAVELFIVLFAGVLIPRINKISTVI